jgi:hypothetical protein
MVCVKGDDSRVYAIDQRGRQTCDLEGAMRSLKGLRKVALATAVTGIDAKGEKPAFRPTRRSLAFLPRTSEAEPPGQEADPHSALRQATS